ncbi:MAG: FG-GAP-like repeat-containing protein, partial [Planctomycetota bacterium]
DGRIDLFATNGIPRFDDDPDVAMEFSELWNSGRIREALRLAQTIPPRPDRNIALRNVAAKGSGLPKFRDVAPEWGLDEMSIGQGAAVVDLDRDGDLDIVVNNQNQDASVFINRGGQDRHSLTVRLEGVDANTQGLGARITAMVSGQRIERLVVTSRGFLGGHEAIEHFGLGDATTVDSLIVDWPSGSRTVLEQIEGDHLLTIRDPKNGEGHRGFDSERPSTWFRDGAEPIGLSHRHTENEFDDFAEQPLVPHRHSRLGPALTVGDFDGDGDEDVFIGGARGEAGTLYEFDAGRFEPLEGPWKEDAASEDLGALFFDADSDGDLDLYVASGSNEAAAGDESYRDRLYRNEGEKGFVRDLDALPDHREATMVVRSSDFDQDGDLDLFVGGRIEKGRYPFAPPSRLYRNEGGRFVDASDLAPTLADSGLVTDALWIDLDEDGREDLVLAAQWQSLKALMNTAEGFVDRSADFGLADKRGLWHGLGAGDVDGDGDLDLIATNLGTNTKYSASDDEPARLYVDDFDDDGILDVIEAKFEDGQLLPVRGRSCSSNAIPMLGEKFPTFEEFAESTLPEIYGAEALEAATVLEVDDLHHILWRRDGERFVAEELPAISQVAPARGVAVGDFDGDGLADVALGQNFFPNEPETGRMAGGLGLVLRGTETGLEAIASRESGVVLREDTVALLARDLNGDGDLDLIAASNNGPVRVLFRSSRD